MQWNATLAAGSQWPQSFTMLDDDTGQPLNLTGLAWEFVIRPNVTDTANPALVQVTTAATAQGYVTVDLVNAVVQVVLTGPATALLANLSCPYALWSNPGQPDRTCWAEGRINAALISQP